MTLFLAYFWPPSTLPMCHLVTLAHGPPPLFFLWRDKQEIIIQKCPVTFWLTPSSPLCYLMTLSQAPPPLECHVLFALPLATFFNFWKEYNNHRKLALCVVRCMLDIVMKPRKKVVYRLHTQASNGHFEYLIVEIKSNCISWNRSFFAILWKKKLFYTFYVGNFLCLN